METSGVETPDDASSSAPSSIATADLSVTLLCISSSDERLSEACRADGLGRRGFVGGSDGTAGLGASKFCVCLAGLGEVVDPAAMVNGVVKGAEPFENSEVLSLGAMIVVLKIFGLSVLRAIGGGPFWRSILRRLTSS